MKRLFTHIRTKAEGDVLILTFLLLGIVMGLGVSLASLLGKEILFTVDVLEGERAYFAAESGVELSLLALKEESSQWIEDGKIQLTDAQSIIDLDNNVETYTLMLEPQENTKFRLRRDAQPDFSHIGVPVELPRISFENLGQNTAKIQWQVLCEKEGKTVSIQNTASLLSQNILYLQGALGTYDDVDGNTTLNSLLDVFWDSTLSATERNNCFLSITNLGGRPVEMLLATSDKNGITPPAANVRATGRAGNREKTVSFQYAQKNIDTLFSFGIFHAE